MAQWRAVRGCEGVCEGVVGPRYPTRERCLRVESRVRVRVPLCAVGRLVVRWYIVAALCCCLRRSLSRPLFVCVHVCAGRSTAARTTTVSRGCGGRARSRSLTVSAAVADEEGAPFCVTRVDYYFFVAGLRCAVGEGEESGVVDCVLYLCTELEAIAEPAEASGRVVPLVLYVCLTPMPVSTHPSVRPSIHPNTSQNKGRIATEKKLDSGYAPQTPPYEYV
jgi:hypothetical protein